MTTKVEMIAVGDNYIYVIVQGNEATVVDPAVAKPVQMFLKEHKLKLTHILITHHHSDHVGGVMDLKQEHGCEVIGPDDARVPGVDVTVGEEDCFSIASLDFTVLYVPGHTSSHIAFYSEKEKLLFCGDALFSVGCGRMFEGTPSQMHDSLQKLKGLNDETHVYCGHEYTENNIRFALSIDAYNQELQDYKEEVDALLIEGKPSIPSLLGVEKRVNPFLNCHSDDIRKELGMEEASNVEVFARLRSLKDSY